MTQQTVAAAGCPIGVVTVSDGEITAVNDAAGELLGTPTTGERIDEAFPTSVEATVPRLFADGRPDEPTEFEEYYPEVDRWLAVTVTPEAEQVTLFVQDVTNRVMTSQRVEQLDGEIDRLAVITELVADVLGEIVDASSRAEIAATICERLGETDRFEFAWLGERVPGTDELSVEAVAGTTGETFEQLTEHLADTPEQAAVEQKDVRVVQPVADDPSVPAPVRQSAFADGIQSAIAVPLTYGETAYGVVGVYTDSQDAFSQRERESFATLGSMAGFAVNAARNRNLLFADTVTAVTFAVTDTDAPLVAASGVGEATLAVEGLVPQEQDRVLCYVSCEGGDPDAVAESLADDGDVAAVRVVADRETDARLEVLLGPETPLRTVSTLGASVGEAVFEDGRGRITAELPSGEEVRRVAEAIRRRFDADTVAKVERDRSVTTAEDLREELADRLTGRQETALRTAYLAGYFESPRDSTAEEVGEALDITGSTLLHHLRAGQRKLLAALLEAGSGEANTGGAIGSRRGPSLTGAGSEE